VLHRFLGKCQKHRCLDVVLQCCIGAPIHIPKHRCLTVFLQCCIGSSENVRNTVVSLFFCSVTSVPNQMSRTSLPHCFFTVLHRCRKARAVRSCAFKHFLERCEKFPTNTCVFNI
jgi:hypothetical protein